MPSAVVHGFEQAWTSADPALLGVATSAFRVQGNTSLQLTAHAGASGVVATFDPASPLDLSQYDELRVWTYASRVADGSPRAPFLLELSYVDAGDGAGEEHRWLVPVNRRRTWEQHRFGIAGDRRGQVTGFSLRCLTDEPFTLYLDEFLAVAEEPLSDVEAALLGLLDGLPLPGVTALPVPPTSAGASTLVVGLNSRLYAGNRITIGASHYSVVQATHDQGAGTTTLTIEPALTTAVGAGATVSVTAPVIVEETPFAKVEELPDPVLLVTLTDQREEPERGWHIPQRDSFRVRDGRTVCGLRPAARPVLAEYQILPAASDRAHSLALRNEILRRVGLDTGLRVNGVVLPVRTLLPPQLYVRARAVPAPVYLHIGTRVEQGARAEVPWVQQGRVLSGPLATPWDPSGPEPPPVPGPDDQEGIVLRL